MNRNDFENVVHNLRVFCDKLLVNKGHDYAGDTDVLTNFKVNAERLGLTPQVVLGIYLNKHLDAIYTYMREGDVASEPIQGRIVDAVNYLTLLYAMVVEEDWNAS